MNRKLTLSLLVAGLAVAGLSTTAAAGGTEDRSTVCLDLHGARPPLPPGFCIGWDDAASQ